MVKKLSKEWTIDAPWGQIAMISWGSSSCPPVLMVHGYVDSAATFRLLEEHLADEYYYVAFDLPGHGKSDPLPPGPMVSQAHMIEPLRRVVEHMGWTSFVYMGHSMAVTIGYIYNTVYPGRITGMILLDPGPALTPYYEVTHVPHAWYKRYHVYYLHNYGKSASDDPKLYEYQKIVSLMGKNRKLSKRQAEVVLSRSLVEVQDGLYRLSWEPRIKTITSLALSLDTLSHISLNTTLPTLITISSIDDSSEDAKKFAAKLIDSYDKLKNCSIVYVDGHHDVHITSAKKMAAHINEFLNKEYCFKSKL